MRMSCMISWMETLRTLLEKMPALAKKMGMSKKLPGLSELL
jgi:hypothetical protein